MDDIKSLSHSKYRCKVTAKRDPSIKRQGKQAYAAIDLFGYMQLQISAEEIFNNIHELRRIEPANGAAESETRNGPAICGDIRDKENRFCAYTQLPNTDPK